MVDRICPMCGEHYTMQLTSEELKQLEIYEEGEQLIQNCFPSLNPMEREFIKTGYCPDCQCYLFESDYTSDKIHNMEGFLDWVKEVDDNGNN